ncbi:MAG: N-acetyl-gamma-glutamyl-phosphate reductase [Phycisphaerales bacterium]|nr:N-acetyl-gamma-glutamyl-phosphate reductase [Phycisphaerales bacterium]
MSARHNELRVVVIGAGGYSGAELVGLLLSHSTARVVGLFGSGSRATSNAERFDKAFPRWRGFTDLAIEPFDLQSVLDLDPHAVFLATPHEASQSMAPPLLSAGIKVFDLSAAFRLKRPDLYQEHYGFTHEHPEMLASAAYGLAELNAPAIANADLIAVPGCYPTSVVLPMRPLAQAGLLEATPLIVDSTSGVSGAGRSASTKSLFCEVSLQPYAVFAHRHQPEMEQEVAHAVVFTPHLGAFDRGILSTIHATLLPGVTAAECRGVLENAYGGQPFIRLLESGSWPSIAGVVHTNHCDIALAVDPARNHLIVCSAIDNLLKGAAGQALQCFNIRFGLPSTLGLASASSSPANELRPEGARS